MRCHNGPGQIEITVGVFRLLRDRGPNSFPDFWLSGGKDESDFDIMLELLTGSSRKRLLWSRRLFRRSAIKKANSELVLH